MSLRKGQSDARIVRQVLAGSVEDFGVLVKRYLPIVYAVAYAHTDNHADAEDATQEAFLQAFRSLDTLREPRKFVRWLVAIARNACNRILRGRQRADLVAEGIPQHRESLAPDFAKRELHSLLRAKVEQLPLIHREVLMLHYFSGKRTREIAPVLGISRVAAKKRLERARDVLGKHLIDELGDALAPYKDKEERSEKIMGAVVALPIAWDAAPASWPSGLAASASQALRGALTLNRVLAVLMLAAAGTAIVILNASREKAAAPARSTVKHAEERPTALHETNTADRPLAPSQISPDVVPSPRSTPAASGPCVIAGEVRDELGRPVGEAQVLAASFDPTALSNASVADAPHRTTTDSDGRFAFRGLPFSKTDPTQYSILAFTEQDVGAGQVAFRKTQFPEVFLLLALQPSSPISGTVRNASGGPAPGATVYPCGQEYRTHRGPVRGPTPAGFLMRVTSDDSGHFSLDNTWGTMWQLCAEAEGYAKSLTEYVSVGTPSVDIVLSQGGTAAGTVADAETGAPISDVELMLMDKELRASYFEVASDAAGRFAVSGLRAAEYIVVTNDDIYTNAGKPATCRVQKDAAPSDILVSVVPGGGIAGDVFDADVRRPIGGVPVWVSWTPLTPWADLRFEHTTITDEEGHYSFRGLPAGRCSVRHGSAAGYPEPDSSTSRRDIQIALGEVKEAVDFAVLKGTTATGTVIDGRGRPVAGAHIQAICLGGYAANQRAYSKGDGTFEVRGLVQSNQLYFLARKNDLTSGEIGPLALPSEGLADVTLEMRPCANVEGQVVDAADLPVGQRQVRLQPEQSPVFPGLDAITGSNGFFKLVGLDAGRYEVNVTPNEGVQEEIVLSAGEGLRGLRLVCERYPETPGILAAAMGGTRPMRSPRGESAVLEGAVFDSNGDPVAGAEILAGESRALPAPRTIARSGMDGTFRAESVSANVTCVSVRHPDYVADAITVELTPGQTTRVTFTLSRGGVVHGTVRLGGEPVPNCYVHAGNTHTQTGPHGDYTLLGIRQGENPLRAYFHQKAEGATYTRRQETAAWVEEGETTAGDFYFAAEASAVEGHVLVDGEPPALAELTLHLSDEGVLKESVGARMTKEAYYYLGAASSGTFPLEIEVESASGSRHRTSTQVTTANGTATQCNFVLQSLPIVVEATRLGRPAPALVAVFQGELSQEEAAMDHFRELRPRRVSIAPAEDDGRVAISVLEPGVYTVVGFLPSKEMRYAVVEVKPNEGTAVRLSFGE